MNILRTRRPRGKNKALKALKPDARFSVPGKNYCPNFSLCPNLYGLTLAVECRSSETVRKDNSCVYTTMYIYGGGLNDTGNDNNLCNSSDLVEVRLHRR